MTIALDASGVFQSYRSGVLTMADGCGTSLNHAVTVVGYTADDGSEPPEPPGPEPSDDCNVHKWWHTCNTPARRLADANGNDNYWKVQNSWGTSWGDQGFILLEITSEGSGVCGMNSYMEYATLKN